MRTVSRIACAAALTAGVLAVPVQAYGITGGAETADGTYRFVAKVDVGESRGCSGVLVDPEWVATAASCFSVDGQPLAAGPPAEPTRVTVGRANLLSGTDGHVRGVVELVPRSDRDLVLARLDALVPDIDPVRSRTGAPVVGEVVRIAGFGRTSTEWVPDRLHTGALSVGEVAPTSITVVGDGSSPSTLCQGDAGGPAFRESSSGVELVGLGSRSWQAGCLSESETRQGASEVRLDDVAAWVDEVVRGGNFVWLAPAASVLDTRSGLGAPAGARGSRCTTTRVPCISPRTCRVTSRLRPAMMG